MSTRCNICYKTESGIYRVIFSHYDGYPRGALVSLSHYYTKLEAVKALVDGGAVLHPHPLESLTRIKGHEFGVKEYSDEFSLIDSLKSNWDIEYVYMFNEYNDAEKIEYGVDGYWSYLANPYRIGFWIPAFEVYREGELPKSLASIREERKVTA